MLGQLRGIVRVSAGRRGLTFCFYLEVKFPPRFFYNDSCCNFTIGSLHIEELQESHHGLQFPNAVVLNAVGRRNTQMRAKECKCAQKSANERKRAQTQVRKRAQMSAKGRKRAQKSASA